MHDEGNGSVGWLADKVITETKARLRFTYENLRGLRKFQAEHGKGPEYLAGLDDALEHIGHTLLAGEGITREQIDQQARNLQQGHDMLASCQLEDKERN